MRKARTILVNLFSWQKFEVESVAFNWQAYVKTYSAETFLVEISSSNTLLIPLKLAHKEIPPKHNGGIPYYF